MVVVGDRCRFRPPDRGATVVWEVTDYCNLACLHCCTDSGPDRDRTAELSTADMLRAVVDMTAAGVTEFYFSGGEPFARQDLVDVIESIDPGAAEVYCNTNGYFIDDVAARRLARTALRRVTMSVDGHSRDVHALVRGKRSSFDAAVRAVEVLLAAGVPVRVSHVVHPGNLDHLADFCATMADLGVRAFVINTVFPAGRAARFPHLSLSAAQQRGLERSLSALANDYAARGIGVDHSVGMPTVEEAVSGCPAGRSVFFVAGNGDVATCSWLYKLDPARFSLGNLSQHRFHDLRAGVDSMMNPLRALAEHCPLPVVGA